MSASSNEHKQNASKLVGTDSRTCSICVGQEARYTCPRCNIPYCSLACYRHEKHGSCSEAFYKDWVIDELSHNTAGMEDREKILEILQREQEARDEDDVDSDDEEEDADDPGLEERLEGLDLDADAGDVWRRLTEKEKQEFSQMLEDGRLANLVEVWTPWWVKVKPSSETEEEVDKLEHDGKSQPQILSDIPDINILLKKSKPSSDLRFCLVNVLYSYAFITRLHNGNHLESPLESAQDLLSVSSVLGQGSNCTSTCEALHMCTHSIQQNPSKWKMSQEMIVDIIEDVVQLLGGPGVVSPLSYVMSALSDVTVLIKAGYKACQKELKVSGSRHAPLRPVKKGLFMAEKKVEFILSWAHRYGMAARDLIPELRLEFELQRTAITSVNETKKQFETAWGGKRPQPSKTLIQEIS
ncbi:zinc finger HIT domain-containing protein 2-like isoform X1 [Haliotis rubra]|uniref:zinc finger HIT domain-containing protein 2-like isoform X1 n=1 Tax=Haliotis rubra TaxID=36100 RepID=UPI001EE55C33|nr:zinc finger HIT domain-containing protein 2-like isoform X1 [Haliotis rubra]